MKPSGEEIKKLMFKAAKDALEEVADDLLDRAQRDVSVQTGALRASGRTTKVRRRGNKLRTSIIFGNASVPYAAAQEFGKMSYTREGQTGQAAGGRIFWEVKKHPGGGKTRYLGDNVKAMVPSYREHIAKAVREELVRAYGR